MDINTKINGVPVLGTIKVENTIYYVDKNKKIYIKCGDDNYSLVEDQETLKKISDYLSPHSIDVI